MMVYVDQSSDNDSGCGKGLRKCGDKSESETDGEITEQSSMSSLMSRLKKADDEEDDFDILAAVKEKKALYEAAIKQALPLKDALIKFFEAGIFSGKKVDPVMDDYEEAYQLVRDTKKDYRYELEKLGINVDDDDLGLEPLDDLINRYQVKEEPQQNCASNELLEKLQADVGLLLKNLPFKEFARLKKFMDDCLADKKRKDTEEGNDMGVVDENGEFTTKGKDGLCKPLCEITCKNPPKKRNKKECIQSREEMIKELTKTLLRGPPKVTHGLSQMQAGDFKKRRKQRLEVAEPIVMATRENTNKRKQKKCLYATEPKEDKNLRAQCFAPACDGRKDFREIVGLHQLKSLFPLLTRIQLNDPKKRVTAQELYTAVTLGEMKTAGFTIETAASLCAEWQKAGRRVNVDEVLFAISKHREYTKLVASGDMSALTQAVRRWERTNPDAIRKATNTNFVQPRSVHATPWGSKGPDHHRPQLNATELMLRDINNPNNLSRVLTETIQGFKSADYAKGSNYESPYAPMMLEPEMRHYAKQYSLMGNPYPKPFPPRKRNGECDKKAGRKGEKCCEDGRLAPSCGLPQIKTTASSSSNACFKLMKKQAELSARDGPEMKSHVISKKRSPEPKLAKQSSPRLSPQKPSVSLERKQSVARIKFSGAGRANPPSFYEIETPKPKASYENQGMFRKMPRLAPLKKQSTPLREKSSSHDF